MPVLHHDSDFDVLARRANLKIALWGEGFYDVSVVLSGLLIAFLWFGLALAFQSGQTSTSSGSDSACLILLHAFLVSALERWVSSH